MSLSRSAPSSVWFQEVLDLYESDLVCNEMGIRKSSSNCSMVFCRKMFACLHASRYILEPGSRHTDLKMETLSLKNKICWRTVLHDSYLRIKNWYLFYFLLKVTSIRCSVLANGYNLGSDIGSTGQRKQELVKSLFSLWFKTWILLWFRKGLASLFHKWLHVSAFSGGGKWKWQRLRYLGTKSWKLSWKLLMV